MPTITPRRLARLSRLLGAVAGVVLFNLSTASAQTQDALFDDRTLQEVRLIVNSRD